MKPGDVRFGLDEDALRYLEAKRLRIPPGAIAIYLDWSPERAERARKRVAYHRAHHRLSRELAFGRTQSENRISLFFSDLGGNAEASAERLSERATTACKILTMEEFSKLQQAQEALTRLTADAQLARNTVAGLAAELAAAERAVQEDGEDCILRAEEPNRDLAKQVVKITAALKAAEQNAKHHEGAIAKSIRIIQSIEERIYAHRRQAFEDAVSGDTKKLHRLIDDLVATSLDLRAKSLAYGFGGEFEPFPSPDRDGSRAEIRSVQNGLYRDAHRLADLWAAKYIDCPYEAPQFQRFPVPQAPRPPADPLQLQIEKKRDERSALQERRANAYADERAAEKAIDTIKSGYRTMGGFLATFKPDDEAELVRLQWVLEATRAETKRIAEEWQKITVEMSKLEKELQERAAAAA